jgi:hypothetical protein
MRARMRCSLRCSGVRRGACGFGLSIVFSVVVQGTVTQGVTIDRGAYGDSFDYSRASVQTKGDALPSEPLAVRVTIAPLSRNLRS